MLMAPFAREWFTAAVVVWMAMDGAQAQTQDIAPINSGANPYRVIRDWAQLTLEKRPWGGSNGVAIDRTARQCGRPTAAHQESRRAVSAPSQTRFTISTNQGRRSGALAAECSCGRMASMSIETETYG